MILQITIWTSLQRRCHKKFWLIRGTKWGEVKVKEAQPPLQLLRRHNLHHFQPRANPHHLSWVGGWSTSFIVLTGIVNDISLGAECCFPFQILWPLFIFSSTQPTTFSWYLPAFSLYFIHCTLIYCPPVYPGQSSHMGWFPKGVLWLPLSSSGSYNFKNQFPSPFHHNTDTNFRYFKRDVSAFRLWLFQVVVCAWGALTFWDSRGSPLFQTIDFDLTPFSVTPFSFSHLSKMWDRHDSCSCSSTALKPFSTFYCRRARP